MHAHTQALCNFQFKQKPGKVPMDKHFCFLVKGLPNHHHTLISVLTDVYFLLLLLDSVLTSLSHFSPVIGLI